jgi:hypothetical protein
LAQNRPMPVRDFRWLNEKEIKQLEWNEMSDEQDEGYIVMCDLDYPETLHQEHNSFPLAPESVTIDWSMLSPYAQGKLIVKKYVIYPP